MIATADMVYWDASALLSVLFQDEHSEASHAVAKTDAVHLVSSLAWTEVHAVIARKERERVLASVLIAAAYEALDRGPWRRLNVSPQWQRVRALGRKWPLRGADLWHLATAKSLQDDFPSLQLLSFDSRLAVAAHGEGLA